MEFPVFLIVVAVVLIVFLAMAKDFRRRAAPGEPRNCPGCAASNPAVARHCRRCGQKLA